MDGRTQRKEQFLRSVFHSDPMQRLNGWTNHRTGQYEPGPLAKADPPSDLFPQTDEAFARYAQYQNRGFSPIVAAVTVMFDSNQSNSRYEALIQESERRYGSLFVPPWDNQPEVIETTDVGDEEDVRVVRCHQCGERSHQFTMGTNPIRYLCQNPDCRYVMSNLGAGWYIQPSEESPR